MQLCLAGGVSWTVSGDQRGNAESGFKPEQRVLATCEPAGASHVAISRGKTHRNG